MIVRHFQLTDGARAATGLVVVIDVFRACTTACYVAAQRPECIYVVADGAQALEAYGQHPDAFLIGKADRDETLTYHAPNSPHLVSALRLGGRTVIHRTAAGMAGILAAHRAEEVITGSFANAPAVVRHILARQPKEVSLVAMGHQGQTPAAEDDYCARLIRDMLQVRPCHLQGMRAQLRAGSGRYFFTGQEQEYPRQDFDLCLETGRFDFVLRAERDSGIVKLVTVPMDV